MLGMVRGLVVWRRVSSERRISFLAMVGVVGVGGGGDILEAGELADEVHFNLGGGAVALLGEDEEGVVIAGRLVFVWRGFFIF